MKHLSKHKSVCLLLLVYLGMLLHYMIPHHHAHHQEIHNTNCSHNSSEQVIDHQNQESTRTEICTKFLHKSHCSNTQHECVSCKIGIEVIVKRLKSSSHTDYTARDKTTGKIYASGLVRISTAYDSGYYYIPVHVKPSRGPPALA